MLDEAFQLDKIIARMVEGRADRVITAAHDKMLVRVLKVTGVRACDIVPVCRHYRTPLYMLDVNGSVYYS